LSIPVLRIIVVGIVYLVDDVQGSKLSLHNNNSQKISLDIDLPNTESKINVLEIGIGIDPLPFPLLWFCHILLHLHMRKMGFMIIMKMNAQKNV